MSIPVWQPGTLYLPGAVVARVSSPDVVPSALTNPDFEAGDTGWTKGTGWTIVNTGFQFNGNYAARFAGTNAELLSASEACLPGQTITANAMVRGDATASVGTVTIFLRWFDGGGVAIANEDDAGNVVVPTSTGWQSSQVTGTAPAGAATVKVGVTGVITSGAHPFHVDSFTWNHVEPDPASLLIFEATQAAAGTSGTTEPVWPTVAAGTVVDGTVTWTARAAATVTWTASYLMVTNNTTEPTWPTVPGEFVVDGSVRWECVGRHIQDVNCPHSKVVAIAASKVFAADGDIVRFCATANPLDWSTAEDAGYLPTGLQQANANDAAVLNLYRSNLAVFNASTFQMWQVDPDPAAMALLDQMESIGSEYQSAAHAVGDELFFYSQLGVRSVSIAVGSTNLSAGDVGEPVDTLTQASLVATLASGKVPIATYYPSAGQFWLAFPGESA